MTRDNRPRPHDLHFVCSCTNFGIPMIRVAAWDESFLRHEGANYRCPNCGRGRQALRVSHPLFGERLRLRRI